MLFLEATQLLSHFNYDSVPQSWHRSSSSDINNKVLILGVESAVGSVGH